MSQETTTIKISIDTRAKLASIGKKGDSYDTIIQELLKQKEASA